VGAYVEPSSLAVRTLSAKDGALTMGFALGAGGGAPGDLEPTSARTFRAKASTTEYRFEPASGKRPATLTRHRAGERDHTYERFVPVTLDPGALAAYAGRYRSDEMTHDLEILLDGGALRPGPYGKRRWLAPLTPTARDLFLAGTRGYQFERDGRGKVAGLVMYLNGHRSMRWSKVAEAPPSPK
jgi:hypothetical protein